MRLVEFDDVVADVELGRRRKPAIQVVKGGVDEVEAVHVDLIVKRVPAHALAKSGQGQIPFFIIPPPVHHGLDPTGGLHRHLVSNEVSAQRIVQSAEHQVRIPLHQFRVRGSFEKARLQIAVDFVVIPCGGGRVCHERMHEFFPGFQAQGCCLEADDCGVHFRVCRFPPDAIDEKPVDVVLHRQRGNAGVVRNVIVWEDQFLRLAASQPSHPQAAQHKKRSGGIQDGHRVQFSQLLGKPIRLGSATFAGIPSTRSIHDSFFFLFRIVLCLSFCLCSSGACPVIARSLGAQ